ncbi:MAG: SAM-dependent methyltransferase, partial [Thermoplasmata archaeon]
MEEPSAPAGDGSPAEAASRVERFWSRLQDRADPAGRVRFDRFMEFALYDPVEGYYSRTDRSFGAGGDFYTAPALGPLFGRAIAERILTAWRLQGTPRTYRVVELGPGDGTLAADITAHLRPQIPPEGRWEYVLVERTGARAEAARKRAGPVEGAIELRTAPRAGMDGPFVGAVVANEVLDAQPCRRFVAREEGWFERFVDVEARREVEARAVEPPARRPAEPGEELEIAPQAGGLLRELSDLLVDGLALLLDYGGTDPGGRRVGSLQTARRHRPGSDPLGAPGLEDLSCWVDFHRMRSLAESAGFSVGALRPQAEALVAWGLPALAA